jgi:type IV secretory pathway VirB6-like protein
MPHEITASGQSGLALQARLLQGTAQVGTTITLTEAPALAGYYTGSVPGGVPAGAYVVQYLNGGAVVASGDLRWDGSAEVLPASGDVPTAAAVAAAVRTNLATELARVDVAVSTREAETAAAARAIASQAEHDATQTAVAAIGTSTPLRADVRAINGQAVQGTGASNNKWRPV